MPNEINLGMPPAGYVLTAARENEQASIQFLEFTSTEDGQHFVRRLEGFPTKVLAKASPAMTPSQVDNLLAVCRRDGTATVFINELSLQASIQPSCAVEVGKIVTKNDIVDIDRLEVGVPISDDEGYIFVFSVGWRKGLYYDFGPIAGPNPQPRKYDIGATFGQAYCHVLFQERFSISDTEWDALFDYKWFPFAGLSHDSIDSLINYVRSDWDPDLKLDQFTEELQHSIGQKLEVWRNHSSFEPHIDILARAVERFLNRDFMSCTALLFPRIEGILRTHHTSLGSTVGASPKNLTNSAVVSKIHREKCLLLPHRFAAYLKEIYFANFNPVAQEIDVSRHSVAHGVASTSAFNQKSALIGLLVVHQLYYFLNNQQNNGTTAKSDSQDESS